MQLHLTPPLPLKIRRSSKARRLHASVSLTQVEVVVPIHVSERSLNAFITTHRNWLEQKYRKLWLKQQDLGLLWPEQLQAEVSIPFQGEQLKLALESGAAFQIIKLEQQLKIIVPASASPQQIQQVLLKWLQQQAQRQAETAVKNLSNILGRAPSSVKLKNLNTIWGSCSPSGAISLNWGLILAPKAVLEYVVAHELCHLVHRNHSVRFWKLVSKIYPDAPAQRRWLSSNGMILSACIACAVAEKENNNVTAI